MPNHRDPPPSARLEDMVGELRGTGMSLRQIAEATRLSHASIWRAGVGAVREPSFSTYSKIAELYRLALRISAAEAVTYCSTSGTTIARPASRSTSSFAGYGRSGRRPASSSNRERSSRGRWAGPSRGLAAPASVPGCRRARNADRRYRSGRSSARASAMRSTAKCAIYVGEAVESGQMRTEKQIRARATADLR